MTARRQAPPDISKPPEILQMPNVHRERFKGNISIDKIESTISVNTKDGGGITFKAAELPDLLAWLETCKKEFR